MTKKVRYTIVKLTFDEKRAVGRIGQLFFYDFNCLKKKFIIRVNEKNTLYGPTYLVILGNTSSLILSKILLKTLWIIVNKIQESVLYDRHTLRKIRRFRHLLSKKSALYYRYTLRENSMFWEFMVKKYFRLEFFD